MGAPSASVAKGPAPPTRQGSTDGARAVERPHRTIPQQRDATQTTAAPALFASIPSLSQGEGDAAAHGARPFPAAGLNWLTGQDGALFLQRQCSACAKQDETELEIRRKPVPAAAPIAIGSSADAVTPLLLYRKCSGCAAELDDEALLVERKPADSSEASFDGMAVQRKCSQCAAQDEQELQLQRKPSTAAWALRHASLPSPAANTARHERAGPEQSGPEQAVRKALRQSRGESLSPGVRREMERAYGVDFGNVRIHVDALAHDASHAVAAQAFTLGQAIYFAPGRYQPQTSSGRELLAHELAHVVQNRNGSVAAPSRKRALQVSSPHDPAEIEADAGARAVLAGRTFRIRGSGRGALQRKDVFDEAVEWGKTTVDKAESAVASGVQEVAHFTAEQLMRLVRAVSPGLAAIIDEGPVNFAKRKVSEALDAHLPAALGGFSLGDLGKGIGSWLGEAKSFVKGLAKGDAEACKAFAGFMHKLGDFAGKLIDNPVIDVVTGALGKLSDFVGKVLKVVGEPLFDGLKLVVSSTWSALKTVAGTISGWFTQAKHALGDVWTQLSSLLGFDGSSEDGVWSWIKGEAGKVWTALKEAVAPIIEPLKKVATAVALLTPMGQIHAIVKYGPKLVKVAQWIWENGLSPEKIRGAPEEIRTMLESIGGNVNGFRDILKTGLDWLGEKLSALGDAVLNAATKISGLPLLGFAHDLFDTARSGLKKAVSQIEKGAEETLAGIQTLGEKIGHFVKPYKEVISSVILAIASPPTIPVILAGWAWRALPRCVKAPILDFVLDIAIKAIAKIPALPTFGPLWALLKPGVLGFLETLRASEDQVKEAVSDKIAKIISGASPDFLLAFIKGFAQGVWEGISDPFNAIWTVMDGLDKATQYLLSLAGFEDKSPDTTAAHAQSHALPAQAPAAAASAKPAATAQLDDGAQETATQAIDPASIPALKAAAGEAAQAIGPDVDTVKGNFWGAVDEYFDGSRMSFADMTKRLSDTWESAKGKIAEGGAWLATQLMTFFKGDEAEAEIGDKVGWLTGSFAFQALLDAITAGTWTEADSILVAIAKFINWPMEALGEAFKLFKKLGKFLLDGLKSLGSAIKETAAGAFKAVSKAVGHIGEKLLAFGEQILGKFGGKAAKAETKVAGALGKEGAELSQREATRLVTQDSAKALEEKALTDEAKLTQEHDPTVKQEPHSNEATSPAETGHIESDKLTPEQLHGETEMLAEHPDMLEGTPPHRRAQVGEHEWTENTLADGECSFCRHSASRVCVDTPELRTAEMQKAEQRVTSATEQAQKRADEAAAARLEADTHPGLWASDRAAYAAELDEATKRANAANARLGAAKGEVTKATNSGDAARLEAAQKKLKQLESDIENAQSDAKHWQEFLGEHDKVLAQADRAEAHALAAREDLAETQKVAKTQGGLSKTVEQKEQEVNRLLRENKFTTPGEYTPAGRELEQAKKDLADARRDLATHIETAQGLTLEIRQALREDTPFGGVGGTARYNEWLEELPSTAKGPGGTYIDYVTGEALPLESLSPDHIVSVDDIFRMEGFGKLAREDQLAVLDFKQNLAFLERGRNSSKQAQSLTQWLASEKELAPSVGKSKLTELEKLENKARKSLQDEIAKRLQRGK